MNLSDKNKVLDALKLAVSIIENDKHESTPKNEIITIEELRDGEFAIFEEYTRPMGILAVGARSFTPTSMNSGYAINLANGIGHFNKTQKCRRATKEEAFAAALKWNG